MRKTYKSNEDLKIIVSRVEHNESYTEIAFMVEK